MSMCTHTHARAEFFLCFIVSKFKSSKEIKMKLNTHSHPLNNHKTEEDFHQEVKNSKLQRFCLWRGGVYGMGASSEGYCQQMRFSDWTTLERPALKAWVWGSLRQYQEMIFKGFFELYKFYVEPFPFAKNKNQVKNKKNLKKRSYTPLNLNLLFIQF